MQRYFVSAQTVLKVVDWRDAVEALQAAYAAPQDHQSMPPRVIGRSGGAWLRTLPALPNGCRYFGAKLMGMASQSATPGVEYVIVLYDRQTSRIVAFVDANEVTGLRTAATSAAAVDRMVPEGQPVRLGVLGSGFEATTHVNAIAAIRKVEALTVFSPTPASREGFAARMSDKLGIKAQAADSAEQAVKGCSIVICAARSRDESPILYGDWLEPGMMVVSIGSTVPEQREIDASVVAACDLIVCDTVEEVVHETGDMLAAKAAGIPFDDKTFSLHSLLNGQLEAQRAGASISMFKSVGAGLQDVVVAGLALDKSIAAGLAQPLDIEFDTKVAKGR